MRDEIIIDVQTMNNRPFKGSLMFNEAMNGVFNTCLGLNTQHIHGIRFAFSTYPAIKFKFKEQINVDQLNHSEYFNFERS